ncbi:hypothetical protein [Paraglaciecola sp.]|uniref:hypothetical protein n=1 Tax=Paraglaciecola sp. TaxID=1920173 RepID=UPI003EF2EF1B
MCNLKSMFILDKKTPEINPDLYIDKLVLELFRAFISAAGINADRHKKAAGLKCQPLLIFVDGSHIKIDIIAFSSP